MDFTNGFWQQSHTWPVLTASAIAGSFALGVVSHDPGGHNAGAYRQFSLQETNTAVNVGWTPFTPREAWQHAYFGANWNNPAVAGDSADPDGDGLFNLLEYALGQSPVAANQSGITSVTRNGTFVMMYSLAKGATDVTVQPEWSTDLLTWSNQGIDIRVLADDGTIQTIQASIPMGTNPKIFGRVHVTRP